MNKQDMLTLSKTMLDKTINPEGQLQSQELCCHVMFPKGPSSVTDLPPA